MDIEDEGSKTGQAERFDIGTPEAVKRDEDMEGVPPNGQATNERRSVKRSGGDIDDESLLRPNVCRQTEDEQADEDMHEETHKPTISVTLTHGKVRILFPPKPSVLPWDRVCSRCAGLGAGADAEEGALETTSAARHAAGSIWPLHVSPTRECALWVPFFWH